MKKKLLGMAFAMTAAVAPFASAAPITGLGTPTDNAALSGGTVIDFESIGNFSGSSLSTAGVTFVANNGNINVSNDYSGGYNTRGQYHITNFGSLPNSYTFNFTNSVSAFGFLFGASDVTWTLTAYNGASVLDTLTLSPVFSSNAGNYFGIAAAGITHATLTTGGAQDYVFIDNFTFAGGNSVPEPGTLALLALGLAGLGLRAKKRQA